MTVWVYFPEAKQPLEYKKVIIARELRELEMQDGSLTLLESGVYLKLDREDFILPWASIREIRMQHQT
jgi:hypothetical protein